MLEYATISEIGGRQINEDSVGVAHIGGRYCFIVCDGLGGHGLGDVASQLVRDTFLSELSGKENLRTYMHRCFVQAQEKLVTEQSKRGAKNCMKTTATVLVVDGNQICVGHIGDSRLYIFAKDRVIYQTKDHSVPQMLVAAGEIEERDIRNHPDRNKLLRVMGSEWERPMFEILEPTTLDQCQAFLLCSDGFWERIEELHMCSALHGAKTAQQWLLDMKQMVVFKDNRVNIDNLSAITVWVNKKRSTK